jgi:hypothetical protein
MSPRLFPEDRQTQRSRRAHELRIELFTQPDEVSCGPTCLAKVYHFFGMDLPLETVLGEIDRNEDGGTLAVFLALAARRRGLETRIFSYDLRIFDPTWRHLTPGELRDKVALRIPHLSSAKARRSAKAYLEFLDTGGMIAFEELTPSLLKRILDRDHPILAGLSATHLYSFMREIHDPVTGEVIDDDIAGDSTGHFIVINGYEKWGRRFIIRDPSSHVPQTPDGRLVVDAQRLINSILLGDLTYDAVLLEVWEAAGKI